MAQDARAAAIRVLAKVLGGESLNRALPPALDSLEHKQRPLLQQLCYGTLRQQPRLQAILDELLEKPLRNKDRDVSALLLSALYQLDEMRVPDHAAVATAVDLSEAIKKPWARKLVNALLRRYLRERDTLLETLPEAARHAHPPWLFGKIHKQWPVDAQSIITANNGQPPMTLRVNSRQTNREDYLGKLASAGITATPCLYSPQGIRLSCAVDVDLLPGFRAGEVSVQDEAAQLAALLLAAQPGERILDACAAPGGKSCHILELQPDLVELVAADIDPRRLQKVEENLERLGLQASLLELDSANPSAEVTAPFDRILVDAPCSASGVIRRHPDVKVLRRPEDIVQLADQQLDILTGLWPLLKPGGTLLYATCSILTEENGRVVERFLECQPDADLETLAADWGVEAGPGRQLLPHTDGPDGLFYAILRKQH